MRGLAARVSFKPASPRGTQARHPNPAETRRIERASWSHSKEWIHGRRSVYCANVNEVRRTCQWPPTGGRRGIGSAAAQAAGAERPTLPARFHEPPARLDFLHLGLVVAPGQATLDVVRVQLGQHVAVEFDPQSGRIADDQTAVVELQASADDYFLILLGIVDGGAHVFTVAAGRVAEVRLLCRAQAHSSGTDRCPRPSGTRPPSRPAHLRRPAVRSRQRCCRRSPPRRRRARRMARYRPAAFSSGGSEMAIGVTRKSAMRMMRRF